MSEKTVYFNDMGNLIVACYERHEFDDFRDTIWTYEIIVKAQARLGIVVHYIMARDIHVGKIKKTVQELVSVINHTVSTALTRNRHFMFKLEDDRKKLEHLQKSLNKGDVRHGT